jgi:hypothetical protein
MSGQLHVSAAVPPEKESPVPIGYGKIDRECRVFNKERKEKYGEVTTKGNLEMPRVGR